MPFSFGFSAPLLNQQTLLQQKTQNKWIKSPDGFVNNVLLVCNVLQPFSYYRFLTGYK